MFQTAVVSTYNTSFLIFDTRAPALRAERQNARMSKIKNGGLDQYGKV